jgi:hypothetical protein
MKRKKKRGMQKIYTVGRVALKLRAIALLHKPNCAGRIFSDNLPPDNTFISEDNA